MNVTPEIAAERDRIREIVNSPQAQGQLRVAIDVALAGASVSDSLVALMIAMEPLSSDQVADLVNSKR
jgi:hypothetical protein